MTAPAHFGRLAWAYRWLEYLSFGPYLERCRNLRLAEMLDARNALVLGDGDGRFVARLAAAAPHMIITVLDASSTMLRHTARRLRGASARVALQQADALHSIPDQAYALIVSHFFLDCFSDAEIPRLLAQMRPAALPGTVWIVSDFATPQGRVMGSLGRLVVGGLYLAFGLLTGLRTRRLPDYAAAMRAAGWRLEDRRRLLGGLLVSERWRFSGTIESSATSTV